MLTHAITEYRERVAPDKQRLTNEQEHALAACFAALEAQSKGKDSESSEANGTIHVQDLLLCLKAFNFSDAQQQWFMNEATLDDTRVLNLDQVRPMPHATLSTILLWLTDGF